MSWTSFEYQGKTYRLPFARSGSGIWIGWPGDARLFGAEARDEARSPREEREIRAPMTGKVVKVPAVAGASVKAGDVLVILEAMKMEYRLAAPREGVIESVDCKEGDRVDLGRTLVRLAR